MVKMAARARRGEDEQTEELDNLSLTRNSSLLLGEPAGGKAPSKSLFY